MITKLFRVGRYFVWCTMKFKFVWRHSLLVKFCQICTFAVNQFVKQNFTCSETSTKQNVYVNKTISVQFPGIFTFWTHLCQLLLLNKKWCQRGVYETFHLILFFFLGSRVFHLSLDLHCWKSSIGEEISIHVDADTPFFLFLISITPASYVEHRAYQNDNVLCPSRTYSIAFGVRC